MATLAQNNPVNQPPDYAASFHRAQIPNSDRPLKAILKNRDNPQTARSDPLQCEAYFTGPLRTIILSVDEEDNGFLSLHDLTEAYNVLSSRIESHADKLQSGTYPAVEAIHKLSSHKICSALRRDMARALAGPSFTTDGSTSVQCVVTEEQRCLVRDTSCVCHASLRLLADLFIFPTLHSCLKLHELAWLFRELVEVGLSQDLPLLSARKTYSYVLAVIHTQRLPQKIFRMFVPKVATILERAARGAMGGNEIDGPHMEGLKTVQSQLLCHGSLFLHEFSTVFTRTLQNLVCSVPVYRHAAAQALTAFADAALREDVSLECRLKYSGRISAFIESEDKRTKKNEPGVFVFRDFLKLSESDPHVGQKVILLLHIAASLIVLSGPLVFTRPKSLKLLVKAIDKTQQFRTRELNVLRAATWNCLVWAYSQMAVWGVRDDRIVQSAFRIVRQDYRGDVGIAVVASLLAPCADTKRSLDTAQEATTYVYHLAQRSDVRAVAVALLRRLLGGVLGDDSGADKCTWSDRCVVPDWLTRGSTLAMDTKKQRKTLTGMPMLDIHTVRVLGSDELRWTWETLVEAFQQAALGQLYDTPVKKSLDDEMISLWQALLNVQAQPTNGIAEEVVCKLSTVFVSLFEASRGVEESAITTSQALRSALQLWTAAHDALDNASRTLLAESIFRRLIGVWQHEIVRGMMSDAWVQLSRQLAFVNPKGALETMRSTVDARAQREIWVDLAQYAVRTDKPLSSESLLPFLVFPLSVRTPILFEDDYDLWQNLFDATLFQTPERDDVYAAVAEELERALSSHASSDLRRFFSISLSRVCLHGKQPPSSALLSVTSTFLRQAYPPKDSESDENEFTDLVPHIRNIVESKPSLEVIKRLEEGLVPWFEDKEGLIDDNDYNDNVMSLYTDIILVIRDLRPAEDTIVALSELLVSPFSRNIIPKPATGPLAFRAFWDCVSPGLDFGTQACPPRVADCVIALATAYGGDIPEWMQSQSQGLESQFPISQSSEEVVPASVEDLASPEFPFVMDKPDDCVEEDDGLETPKAHILNSVTVGASPRLGEPSEQFAHHVRSKGSASPVICVNLDRARKRRKVSSPGLSGVECSADSRTSGNQAEPSSSIEATMDPSRRGVCDGVVLSGMQSDERQKCTRFVSPETHSSLPYELEVDPSSDDYASWEVGVSLRDLHELQREDSGAVVDRSPSIRRSSPDLTSRNQGQQVHTGRSQTAPAVMASSAEKNGAGETHDEHNSVSLRRTHTASCVPLDALEQLRSAVSSDARVMETQDLAQAAQMIHELAGIVNERISEKLGEKRSHTRL